MKQRLLLALLAITALGLAGCTTSHEEGGATIENRWFGGDLF